MLGADAEKGVEVHSYAKRRKEGAKGGKVDNGDQARQKGRKRHP